MGESSSKIKERVNRAREIQKLRYQKYGIFSNSELTPKLMDIYCKLDIPSKTILEKALVN